MRASIKIVSVFLGLAVAGGPTAVHAQNAIEGEWFNTLIIDGLPQPIWIKVQHTRPGEGDGATISFSKPRSCSIEYEYGGEVNNIYYYYYQDYNEGGFCKTAAGARLELTLNNAGELIYSIVEGGSTIEKGVVLRSSN